MSASFDPYRELLDIKTADRPPDHYALLGLTRFESDRQKIDDAATQRMSMLQDMANSDHVDQSQKLLNELSAARRCLLNDVQKVAYDESLRNKSQRKKVSRKSRSPKRQFLIWGVATALLVLLGVFVLMRQRKSDGPANLLVEWAMEDREGAQFLIDGKLHAIPNAEPMQFNVPDGRHTIEFRRAGFRSIEQRLSFTRTPVRLKLRWIPE